MLGGSSFTSVLARDLTFDAQVALFTGAGYDGDTLDTGTFSVSIAPAPGYDLAEAEAALDAAVAAFLEEGVDPAQLERIRTQVAASEIYARDNVEGLARDYGASLAIGLGVEDVEAWPDVLAAVTADDVMAAARAVLDPDASVTLWVRAPEPAPDPRRRRRPLTPPTSDADAAQEVPE